MARTPEENRRILERRNELARAQGYSSYRQLRDARAAGTAPSGGPRQVVRTSVGSIVTSAAQQRTVEAQLRNAEAKGQHVKVTATIGGRQVELFSKGGMTASKWRQLVDTYGLAGAIAHAAAQVYGDDAGDASDVDDWQMFVG